MLNKQNLDLTNLNIDDIVSVQYQEEQRFKMPHNVYVGVLFNKNKKVHMDLLSVLTLSV